MQKKYPASKRSTSSKKQIISLTQEGTPNYAKSTDALGLKDGWSLTP
jgi:hypothetical protein